MSHSGNNDSNYQILDRESLPAYLEKIKSVVEVIGTSENYNIDEIGDGNLNFVYRVSKADNSTRAVIVKQAVPYLRMAGESWPLSKDRALFEIRALKVYNELVPNLAPLVYHSDEQMSTVVMQCLGDHIILRHGMMNAVRYPNVATHIGTFMAETLFRTSAWSLDSLERRELMQEFNMNTELCKLTEDFIFTFPFIDHESNYSNPQTDDWAREFIHKDYELKRAVLEYKTQFLSKSEALLHGDLHSGSLMVNETETYAIDPEFAFFGPISFDVGKVFSNFLLSYTSHFYRSGGADYRGWLLVQIPIIWDTFERRFIDLWENSAGSALLPSGFISEQQLSEYRSLYMQGILQDAIGFMSCSMVRRTVGIAGVADIRDIEDIAIRSELEITNLKFAKCLMRERHNVYKIDDLIRLIDELYEKPKI